MLPQSPLTQRVYCLSFALVGPTASITPNMTAVTEGNNITLTCDVTGIPSPTIEWREEGKNEVLGSGSNFTIHNALRVAGNAPLRYTCTASNGVEIPAQAQVSVYVQCEYENADVAHS